MSNTLQLPVEAVAAEAVPVALALPHRLREFALYFAASLAGLCVDAATLVMLVQWFGMAWLPAATLAFLAGSLAVYLLSVRFAFEYRRVRDTRYEFVTFAALGMAGLCVTLGVMWVGTDLLQVDYRFSKGAAAGASFLANFTARKLILFTAR
ncbi:MAG: GtrA family protein [Ramlibacter sp.]|nr:GtrA family protein [Ramlibacter sp.]